MPQFSRIGKKSLTVIGLEEQWVKPSPKVDETELLHHTSQRTDQFGHLLQYAMLETKKSNKIPFEYPQDFERISGKLQYFERIISGF